LFCKPGSFDAPTRDEIAGDQDADPAGRGTRRRGRPADGCS